MFYINRSDYLDNLISFGFKRKYNRYYYVVPAYKYKKTPLIYLYFTIFENEYKLIIDCKSEDGTFYPDFYNRPLYRNLVLEEIDKVLQNTVQEMLKKKILITTNEDGGNNNEGKRQTKRKRV